MWHSLFHEHVSAGFSGSLSCNDAARLRAEIVSSRTSSSIIIAEESFDSVSSSHVSYPTIAIEHRTKLSTRELDSMEDEQTIVCSSLHIFLEGKMIPDHRLRLTYLGMI